MNQRYPRSFPQKMSLEYLLPSAKRLISWLISSRNIYDQAILQIDWVKVFWSKSLKSNFASNEILTGKQIIGYSNKERNSENTNKPYYRNILDLFTNFKAIKKFSEKSLSRNSKI